MESYGLERQDFMEEEQKDKKKAILVLDGVARGKTRFLNFAKDSGIWVWSISSINVLTAIAHKLYWDSNKTREFYDFLTEFSEMANRYFNFEEKYIATMLEKFFRNNRVDLLVIHNCSERVRDILYKAHKEICFGIRIVDSDLINDSGEYHYILNCDTDFYDDDIKITLDKLLGRGG